MFHLFSDACCKCFPLDVAKLVLEVAKVHLLFKFSHARAKQSDRNRVHTWKGAGGTVPQGPSTCNGAGGAARETE
jgi:hypothetical protein